MKKSKLKPSERNYLIAFILGFPLTWLGMKYVFIPLLSAFGMATSWWMYVVLFMMIVGTIYGSLNTSEAMQKKIDEGHN